MNQTGAPGYWHRLRHLLRHSPDFILVLSVIKEAAMMDKMDGIKKEREKRKW